MLASYQDLYSTIVSKKYPIRFENFLYAKRTFIQLYRQSMYQLYIMGYQSDPHRFDEREARLALIEDGYNLATTSGSIDLSVDNLLIHMAKEAYTHGESLFTWGSGPFVSVFDDRLWSSLMSGYRSVNGIYAVYLTMLLRQNIEMLDSFYESSDINKVLQRRQNNKSYVYSPTAKISTRGADVFCEATHMALTGKLVEMTTFSTNSNFWELAQTAGVPLPPRPSLSKATAKWANSADYQPNKPAPGQLIRGMSFIDEQVLLPALLSGRFTLDTQEGREVYKIIREAKKSWVKGSLLLTLRTDNTSELNDAIEKSVTSHAEITLDNVLFIDKDNCYVGKDTGLLPLVCNSLGYDVHGNTFNFKGIVSGLCGELLKASELTEPDGSPYTPRGVPLTSSYNLDEHYYDVEFALHYGDIVGDYTTRFKDEYLTVKFGTTIDEEILEMYEPSNLVSTILMAYTSAEAGFFGPVFYEESLRKKLEDTLDMFFSSSS